MQRRGLQGADLSVQIQLTILIAYTGNIKEEVGRSHFFDQPVQGFRRLGLGDIHRGRMHLGAKFFPE